MGLTAGIAGLPNVGKSTLFNAITNSQVEAANYPFATIQPNTGIVEVPDYRLDELCEIFKPLKRSSLCLNRYSKVETRRLFPNLRGLDKKIGWLLFIARE